jgi:hypothetical protein
VGKTAAGGEGEKGKFRKQNKKKRKKNTGEGGKARAAPIERGEKSQALSRLIGFVLEKAP